MKAGLRILSVLLILTLAGFYAGAQKLTGIWRGYFVTETGEEYRLEFQVRQSKSLGVTGVSYSYLDKRFYGKASMTGNFALRSKSFQIQETRTTEVQNLGGGGTCLMNYKFTYSKSGAEEFLEGAYVGKNENREDPKKNGVWGDCGGGKVYLRRVETSDFYVEPFLRQNVLVKKTTPSRTNPVAKKTLPTATPKVVTAPRKKPAPPVAASKPAVKKTTIPPQEQTASVPQPAAPPADQKPTKVVVPRELKLPLQTRSRKNELVKTLDVTSPEVAIRIYDNGEIDDDTISVYLDDRLVLSQKRLSTAPLSLTVKLDDEQPEHVLIMVAENLGRIPPNTSLMIVTDGDKRYEVRITSTEQKNAMIRFRYQKPLVP